MIIEVPIRTWNEANGAQGMSRGAAIAKSKRRKQIRGTVELFLRQSDPLPRFPVVVTLTRLGPNNRKMDTDGLANALKSTRDAIAEHYGVDDGDDRYEWKYGQERAAEYAVRIVIEPQRAYYPMSRNQ